MVRPLSPKRVFLFSRNSRVRFWGLVFWYLWIGGAKKSWPSSSHHLAVEVFNVGGWLAHGDLALDAGLDFLAVTQHRLIPARVRSEWARLRAKGVASIWAPASQDASHVGNAGVGVVSLRGAPLTLPTCVTAHFKSFFDCGPCMLVGDFNVEPTKIPCLAKGISAGLWVDLEGSWALATGRQPSSTCMREWGSSGGTRRDFMGLGALFLLLLFCLARFRLTGGLRLILLFGPSLTMSVGLAG